MAVKILDSYKFRKFRSKSVVLRLTQHTNGLTGSW